MLQSDDVYCLCICMLHISLVTRHSWLTKQVRLQYLCMALRTLDIPHLPHHKHLCQVIINNMLSKNFDERPHRRLVTICGYDWIRSYDKVRGSLSPHELAPKWHLYRVSRFLHTQQQRRPMLLHKLHLTLGDLGFI